MPKRTPNKFQRVAYSAPFLLILAVVVVLVANSAWNMYQTHRDTKETIDRLRQEQQELLARENAVADAASDLSTQRGLEEEIREKFSVAKEGERVIILVDGQNENATTTDKEPAWWERFWQSAKPW